MISGNNRAVALGVLLLTLLMLGDAAPAAHADAAIGAGRWTLSQLLQEFRQVKRAKARFVERQYLNILNQPVESTGTLLYVAPNHLEKDTEKPKPENMLVEGDTLTVTSDDGRRRQTLSLEQFPEIWALIESMRATLAGDENALTRYYNLHLDGDAHEWHLTLEPNNVKIQKMIRSILITGSGNELRMVEVRQGNGDRAVMTVTPDAS